MTMTDEFKDPQAPEEDEELRDAFKNLGSALQHKAEKELAKKLEKMTLEQLENTVRGSTQERFATLCAESVKALTALSAVLPQLDLEAVLRAHCAFQVMVIGSVDRSMPPRDQAIEEFFTQELEIAHTFIKEHEKHVGIGCPLGELLYRRDGEFAFEDEDASTEGAILEYGEDKEAS